MRLTTTPAARRFPRTAKLALVGATVTAGATGFAVLGAGPAFAQAPRATLAVAHEHHAAPDHGSADRPVQADRHVQKEPAKASLDRASTVRRDPSGSKDRLSAARLEHKSAAVEHRSDSGSSIDRTATTGTAVTYDR